MSCCEQTQGPVETTELLDRLDLLEVEVDAMKKDRLMTGVIASALATSAVCSLYWIWKLRGLLG